MRICIVCGKRPAPIPRRLCRTCETDKYMGQLYDNFKQQFAEDNTPLGRLMNDFMKYLDGAYGNQKREIAYRTRYTLEAINCDAIAVKEKWSIQDIINIENYRRDLSVQRKTALYHFIEFLKQKANLHKELEELKILQVIDDIPPEFQNETKKYLNYLHSYRKLKHWTRYQIAYSMKYFFSFIVETYKFNDIKQITREHIVGYIHFIRTKNSQKNAYNRFREISSFFIWSHKHKISFANPCKNVKVNYGYQMTQSVNESEQRKLVKQWMHLDANPREALIGILSLIYACSPEEITKLTLDNLYDNTLTVPGRPIKIEFPPEIKALFERYLIWRESICKGAKNDYLFISRTSYKINLPITPHNILRIIKRNGLSPRELRSTRIQDIACTGNVKLLEGLGLSYEGSRPYLSVAAPVLLMEHDPKGLLKD